MNKRYIYISGLLILILSFSSCLKDKFNVEETGTNKWEPDIAAPVINTSVSMKDIIDDVENQEFSVGNDQLVSLLFRDEVFVKKAEDIISIQDNMQDSTFSWNYPVGLPVGDSASQTYIYTQKVNAGTNEIIDSLFIKSGTLSYSVETDLNHDGVVELTIPGLTQNGSTFSQELVLDYTGNIPHSASNTFNLSGYKMVFNHSGPGNNNYLQADVKMIGIGDNNANNSPYQFKVETGIKNIEFSKIFGYLSQHNFKIDEDSLNVDYYSSSNIQDYILEDPRMYLEFYNSFGMPVKVSVNKLKAYNPQSVPSEKELTKSSGAPLDDIMINAPSLNQVGDVVITNKVYDKTNSNYDKVVDIDPQKMVYEFEGLSNPSGGNNNNFALDTSKLRLETVTEFPLFGRAWNFLLEDTVDFELGDDFQNEADLKSAEFQIFTSSEFPVDASVQVYFTDSNFVVLDSLFKDEELILSAADPGPAPDYKVKIPQKKRTYITRDADQLDKILDARKAIIRVKSSTVNDGNQIVKIYSDYNVDVKLGARAKFETEY